ncbi:MAG: DivIVA domain-containing protein [Acidimicrobiaceae bacterium]|nr:DivIVA domain-containing protein [Acidimicrobiaceae bacterium]
MTETPDIEPESAPPAVDSLSDDALNPDDLEARSFPITRRGFDPAEVRSQLREAASEIRRLQRLCNELTGRLTESQQAGRGDAEARRATEMLGAEVSSVLEAAHNAAASRIERADSEAEAISHEARSAAESVLADAAAQSTELIATARLEADEIVEESRNQGREMVNEAQAVRERMLRDLARKRQTGRTQIEQLRAGRDRLLDALTTVQNSLDTAIEDLVTSVPEARTAANRAGLRISSEPSPTADDLEAEIEAGRLVGQPLVSDSPLPGPISDTFTTGEMEALDHLDALSVHAEETDGAESAESARPDPDPDPEPEPDPDPDPEPEPEAALEPRSVAEPQAEADPETEGPALAALAGNARDIFARLRSARAETDSEPAPEQVAESARSPKSETEEAKREPQPASEESSSANSARERAADAAAKAMKKVLVEEQGSLLDRIRRRGAAAMALFDEEASHNAAYDQAAIPALREQCVSLGGSPELDLTPALANIHEIALEPVRRRLADIAQQFDSEQELSDAVRALYREARSRHLNDAASAASVAVDGLVKIDEAHKAVHKGKAELKVRWVVNADGSCGADCADNALAGEVIAGEKFPTGDRFPPAHPMCTCRLEVV